MHLASLARRAELINKMAGQPTLSFSAALSKSNPSARSSSPAVESFRDHAKNEYYQSSHGAKTGSEEKPRQAPYRRRSPSPSHIPQTGSEEETVYVLTIQTDKAHHARMTQLRDKYFPKRSNKLEAHLTLFHALPGSRLESDITPTLEDVAKAHQFRIVADKPFRMKKGIAVSISEGQNRAKNLRTTLQNTWKQSGFLSQQDAGGARLHYTFMNKVDDEREVDKAYQDLVTNWQPDEGTAVGLGLWKYDRGFWRWERGFNFMP